MLQESQVRVLTGSPYDSTVLDTGINQIVAINVPSGLASTEVAIHASVNGVDFSTVYKADGTAFAITDTTNDGYYLIPPEVAYALPRFIKLIPNDADEDVTFDVYMREV